MAPYAEKQCPKAMGAAKKTDNGNGTHPLASMARGYGMNECCWERRRTDCQLLSPLSHHQVSHQGLLQFETHLHVLLISPAPSQRASRASKQAPLSQLPTHRQPASQLPAAQVRRSRRVFLQITPQWGSLFARSCLQNWGLLAFLVEAPSNPSAQSSPCLIVRPPSRFEMAPWRGSWPSERRGGKLKAPEPRSHNLSNVQWAG